MLNPGCCFLAF
jgi:hypothetical protein